MMRMHTRAAAAVAALALVTVPGLTACGQAAEKAAEVAAEQALGGDGQDVDISEDGLTVTDDQGNEMAIGENVAIPDTWPAEVPLVEGGTVQMVSVQGDNSALAVWQVSGAPQEAIDSYAAALEAGGFTQDSTTNMGGMIVNQYTGNGFTVTVQALDADGTTNLTVTAEKF